MDSTISRIRKLCEERQINFADLFDMEGDLSLYRLILLAGRLDCSLEYFVGRSASPEVLDRIGLIPEEGAPPEGVFWHEEDA